MHRAFRFCRRAVAILTLTLSLAVAANAAASPADEATSATTVTLPAARRIVALAPSIAETVFAVGAGAQLAGVSDFCVYPDAARALPSCGGWDNPNYETLTALKPDLILIQGRHEKIRQFGAARGLRVEDVDMNSVAGILAGIEKIGALTGRVDSATSLTAQIRSSLDRLARQTPPLEKRPRVFVSVDRQPGSLEGIFTVAGGSFLDEAVALAGGRNIFADVDQPYPQASKESLVARRPEIILELAPLTDGTGVAERRRRLQADWQKLSSLPAVRNGKIRLIADDYILTPGPRLDLIVQRLHAAMYGEPEQ
jgi:iron complex transport system substrate-binding protein